MGEDGLVGFSDTEQRLCLGLALWNGCDPILEERAYGLWGFLGLDNIGPIDRSHLPDGWVLEQPDATGWMAIRGGRLSVVTAGGRAEHTEGATTIGLATRHPNEARRAETRRPGFAAVTPVDMSARSSARSSRRPPTGVAGTTTGSAEPLSYLTPARTAAGARLARTGATVSLGQPLRTEARIEVPEPADHHMTMLTDVDIGSGSLRFAEDYVGVDLPQRGAITTTMGTATSTRSATLRSRVPSSKGNQRGR